MWIFHSWIIHNWVFPMWIFHVWIFLMWSNGLRLLINFKSCASHSALIVALTVAGKVAVLFKLLES